MLHKLRPQDAASALSRALFVLPRSYETEAAFPHAAFALLANSSLAADPPLEPARIGDLLRLLAAIGRGDLSVGRIYEGHVNALLLIRAYGSDAQREAVRHAAADGAWLGVWNTDAPGHPLTETAGTLSGAKNFASGVDGLSRAIVTVPSEAGRQMLLMPLADAPVDRSWWDPMGMRGSGSHVVDFSGVVIDDAHRLGRPGDYTTEPWFSGGAIRFAAVQVGGLHAVFDVALEHLTRTGRAADPYQAQRLARMGLAVDAAHGWLVRGARAWASAAADPADAAKQRHLVATANATRSAVEAAALAVLEDAERAVGAAGFNRPHPLERLVRDLRTYLRQPNPDGALRALGDAIAAGDWLPGEGPDA
ncbi:acyl-CoA dehydrogenase family protein [Aurantimonas sp. A2-1-M11]|uniref:acyl-CoA dehydrogenase family protein n=1 Tax=Aurantimonas sp. A2-1-M11 TaxID=3113712 RepID=UPI002F92AEBC